MEAGTLTVGESDSATARAKDWAGRHPAGSALIILAVLVVAMIAAKGLHEVAETALAGLSTGAIYALGAVGLTLVYGILKLVNFAHGDFVTFGAYMAYLANVTWGVPLVFGLIFAMVVTAGLGVLSEKVMWAPDAAQARRAAAAGADVDRARVPDPLGDPVRVGNRHPQPRRQQTATVEFLGLSIGRTQLITIVVGIIVIIGDGLMLRFTLLGKRMRALSDDLDLAETAGINT